MIRVNTAQMTQERFIADCLERNQPVVITGELDSWQIEQRWTPAALEQRLGDQVIQIYNNYFDLKKLQPLRRYLAENFGGAPHAQSFNQPVLYARWYTKLRDVDFFWADEAFNLLSDSWKRPGFLPMADYLLPYAPYGERVDPVVDPFPAKGLFISPAGARTSLHVDPWGSCAVLCQLYGRKRWFIYAPDQRRYLCNGTAVVDIACPDRNAFPAFDEATLAMEFTLEPGEIVYIPHGWFHQVHSETDSISLTWNFVHGTTGAALLDWLTGAAPSRQDRNVLQFFYSRARPGVDLDDIKEMIERRVRGH